jgi:hypothetical protein
MNFIQMDSSLAVLGGYKHLDAVSLKHAIAVVHHAVVKIGGDRYLEKVKNKAKAIDGSLSNLLKRFSTRPR